MKHIVVVLSSLFMVLGLWTRGVNAQTCTNQYGAAVACQPTDLIINKEVKNPATGVFVENLSSTDPTFSPGSEVLFRLTIKNTSGETFSPVRVRDVFPEFLAFEAGPGNYNATNRTLDFEIDKLPAGESRSFEIIARVEPKAGSQGNLFCVTNYSVVSAPARPAGDDDTAQLCIQTRVLGAVTLPVAGVNDLMLLIPFAALGLGGLALIKKKA